MDKSLEQIQTLHPKLRERALQAYNEAVKETPKGVHPVITQGLRSFEESERLYAQGRTTKGSIVTNAKAGSSFHNFGLAIDFVLVVNGKEDWDVNEDWMTVVNIFKSHGFGWGGNWKSFKDYPHLEYTFGYSWQELLAKHSAKDFIVGTTYVNI